jgi:hypothetical protein
VNFTHHMLHKPRAESKTRSFRPKLNDDKANLAQIRADDEPSGLLTSKMPRLSRIESLTPKEIFELRPESVSLHIAARREEMFVFFLYKGLEPLS